MKIVAGDTAPGPNDDRRDVVMMDDFLYGEPTPYFKSNLILEGAPSKLRLGDFCMISENLSSQAKSKSGALGEPECKRGGVERKPCVLSPELLQQEAGSPRLGSGQALLPQLRSRVGMTRLLWLSLRYQESRG